MKIDVELKGMNKAISSLKHYEVAKQVGVKQIIAETAETITSQAKAITPVGHYPNSKRVGGNLKNSINASYYKGGLSAEIGTPVHYAVLHEPSFIAI